MLIMCIVGVISLIIGIICLVGGDIDGTFLGIVLVVVGCIVLYGQYSEKKENDFLTNEVNKHISDIKKEGYLSSEIEMQIEKEINDEGISLGRIYITGSLPVDTPPKQVYLKISKSNLFGSDYFIATEDN